MNAVLGLNEFKVQKTQEPPGLGCMTNDPDRPSAEFAPVGVPTGNRGT